MPLNRVIVPTVRLATVYMRVRMHCCCREQTAVRCLNKEGAQRPSSPCGVWNWMIGPPFSLSICPPVCLFIALRLAFSLTDSHPHAYSSSPSFGTVYFVFLLCVCMFVSAAVLCVSSWQHSQINCLLAAKPALWLAPQYACYSAYKLPVDAEKRKVSMCLPFQLSAWVLVLSHRFFCLHVFVSR